MSLFLLLLLLFAATSGSSSSSGCSSSATCELYDLATAHALLARQQQLIQQANFPLISSAELVQQLAHHQQLQQLQHHIQGIVHHNLVGDMALVSHPATAAAVGAAPMYAGSVAVPKEKKPQPTPHQVMQMQQQQLPQFFYNLQQSTVTETLSAPLHMKIAGKARAQTSRAREKPGSDAEAAATTVESPDVARSPLK
ncbi:hypothetical protein Aduo_007625 [Ancylostoma duodenale]